jgi:hypothetical protein
MVSGLTGSRCPQNYAATMRDDADRTPEDLFDGYPQTLAICHRVLQVVSSIGEAAVTTSKSQVAFRHHKSFAYVWRPGQYVDSDVPAVLSIALSHAASSKRFKEVVHPSSNVWMHHVELTTPAQVDDEIRAWLMAAYRNAS